MLKDKVENTIKNFSLISENSKVLVALSGGPDSVTLLHILLQLKEKLKIDIAAAHLNHMLRGEESERDENFVKKLCSDWGIPLFTKRENIKEISKGKNIEAVAREVRYRFLEETLKKINGDYIATGHTASDLVETVILNLTKGTGIKGFRGFFPKREKIIRPLFEVTREEIENYIKENNIPFVVDSSNLKTEFERNLIRIEVIPVLKKINPKLEEAVLRNTSILREIEDYINKEVENLLRKYLSKNQFCIPLEKLKKLEPVLRKELLIKVFKTITGRTLSYKKLEFIENVIKKKEYKELKLTRGYVIFKDQENFCIEKENGKEKEYFIEIKEIPSKVETPMGIVEFDLWDGKEEGFLIPYKEAISKGIVVRNRRPGDRLSFKNFSKPLKKVFIEKKIPVKKRNILPIVQVGDKIVWIPGVYKAYINFIPNEKQIVVRLKSGDRGSNTRKFTQKES
ncbi:tRNA(Ile)-lysidine synthase [Desulfurobacterium thermolithotrophum DSM 11699]|uniref:tRNA(Ile)-lysidine synthase n=1 Tax=Desulfurobacterium thermolithotrophum (strain DSM 11699 / BSA) TaxID=868864 RepID=F0RZZ4_DESTD|nr:tRNA lysidine(34) synthetase TilS [Desulfurobacterium thermolithotrophum]ADY73675.1 tRNA(Ile)-lysidine synthase [Desulfurobacterium thermolithotrophum DSM 11699]